MLRKIVLLLLLLLLLLQQKAHGAPVGMRQAYMQLSAQLNPYFVRAMSAYHRLERSVPQEELRSLTTIGLLNGARKAEQQMEQNLVAVIKELLAQTDLQSGERVLPKIDEIEQQLERDQHALDILSSAMDMATMVKNERTFRQEMHEAWQQQRKLEQLAQQQSADVTQQPQLGERLASLRQHIQRLVPSMKSQLDAKIEHTLEHLLDEAAADGLLGKASQKLVRKRAADQPAEIRAIKSILSEDDFRENLVVQQFEKRPERQTRKGSKSQKQTKQEEEEEQVDKDDDEFALDDNSLNVTESRNGGGGGVGGDNGKDTKAKQQEDSAELMPPDMEAGGGGGLVGLIGSLSGGEGGSDVGALIGALTGLISTLFGPGGLDIESLLSTATSLLAGLLSGNKNFGTVLGQYVGVTLDGLSGGGGAINNGQFLGNLLGTVVASLSADPEEEAGPQPLIFAQNLLSSFMEAKNRPLNEEASEDPPAVEEPTSHKKAEGWSSDFDSGGFVKKIASHLVSSALSLLLNASLGASGGALHASAGLLGSSSSSGHGHHMKHSDKSWALQ